MQQFTKQQAREMAPAPYVYAGYWDGFYHYQKGSYQDGGFYEMRVIDEDMTNGNLEFMAKHGLTR